MMIKAMFGSAYEPEAIFSVYWRCSIDRNGGLKCTTTALNTTFVIVVDSRPSYGHGCLGCFSSPPLIKVIIIILQQLGVLQWDKKT
jgi:hypothetical protein